MIIILLFDHNLNEYILKSLDIFFIYFTTHINMLDCKAIVSTGLDRDEETTI